MKTFIWNQEYTVSVANGETLEEASVDPFSDRLTVHEKINEYLMLNQINNE
jgi:hypothetical protein